MQGKKLSEETRKKIGLSKMGVKNPNCRECHLKTNFNRKDWIEYFNVKEVEASDQL